MFDWAAQKAEAQRQVHKAFAVRCLYRETRNSQPVELSARLHTRITVGGSEGNAGYATIIEGVTRVVFDKAELIEKNIIVKPNALVTFPDYGSTWAVDIRDPSQTNAVSERWSLAGQ